MELKILGVASGIGAELAGAELGVWHIYYNFFRILKNKSFNKIFYQQSNKNKLAALQDIAYLANKVSSYISSSFSKEDKFLFFSGDHSCAVGIWAGIANLIQEDLGIIWIDAHLDMNTPQTTPSGNIHGMPVASLLGHGPLELTNIIKNKIKPQNMCFIGTRSYENEELALAKQLGIKIIFMNEITDIKQTLELALNHVSKYSKKIAISLDIDSMDPSEMPGTGCYNPGGLSLENVKYLVSNIAKHPKYIGLELTEYNPLLDTNLHTFNGIQELIRILDS